MEHVAPLIITIVVTAVGATWALRSALAAVEAALSKHAAEDAQNFQQINKDLVVLKGRAKKR